MKERIQKILVKAGYGARRKCELLIKEGRVAVNGNQVVIGEKADPAADVITVDGTRIEIKDIHVYILAYKPVGVISSKKRQDSRKTIYEAFTFPEELFIVGRLDANSEGLILMTNDGKLAYKLTHPKFRHEKEYHLQVAPLPRDDQITLWKKGILLEDGFLCHPAGITVMSHIPEGAWLKIVIKEGHKRQLRESAKALNLTVRRLIRTRMGSLRLGDLQPGEWRYLSTKEIATITKEDDHLQQMGR